MTATTGQTPSGPLEERSGDPRTEAPKQFAHLPNPGNDMWGEGDTDIVSDFFTQRFVVFCHDLQPDMADFVDWEYERTEAEAGLEEIKENSKSYGFDPSVAEAYLDEKFGEMFQVHYRKSRRLAPTDELPEDWQVESARGFFDIVTVGTASSFADELELTMDQWDWGPSFLNIMYGLSFGSLDEAPRRAENHGAISLAFNAINAWGGIDIFLRKVEASGMNRTSVRERYRSILAYLTTADIASRQHSSEQLIESTTYAEQLRQLYPDMPESERAAISTVILTTKPIQPGSSWLDAFVTYPYATMKLGESDWSADIINVRRYMELQRALDLTKIAKQRAGDNPSYQTQMAQSRLELELYAINDELKRLRIAADLFRWNDEMIVENFRWGDHEKLTSPAEQMDSRAGYDEYVQKAQEIVGQVAWRQNPREVIKTAEGLLTYQVDTAEYQKALVDLYHQLQIWQSTEHVADGLRHDDNYLGDLIRFIGRKRFNGDFSYAEIVHKIGQSAGLVDQAGSTGDVSPELELFDLFSEIEEASKPASGPIGPGGRRDDRRGRDETPGRRGGLQLPQRANPEAATPHVGALTDVFGRDAQDYREPLSILLSMLPSVEGVIVARGKGHKTTDVIYRFTETPTNPEELLAQLEAKISGLKPLQRGKADRVAVELHGDRVIFHFS